MKRFVTVLLAVALVGGMVGRAGAVDFQEEIKKLAQQNAEGYIGPLATAFGTCMNSGLYHTAKPHKLLGFDVSIKPSAALVGDEYKFFDFIVPPSVTVDATALGIPGVTNLTLNGNDLYPNRKTATMFGPDTGTTLLPDEAAIEAALRAQGALQAAIDAAKLQPEWQYMLAAATISTPPGLGLEGLPLVLPQASVGLIFGTEVLVRYLPEMEIGDFGKLNFWGFGVKHSISQWIPLPLLGIDITGQYAMQQLKLGELLESNHTAMNLQVSRRFGFMILSLTPYAGVGFESSDLKLDYTIQNSGNPALDGSHVTFDLEGDNSTRITVGGRLQFLMLTVNADYSMGEFDAYSAGVGLTLR